MNAINGLKKVVVCGAAALALTAASGWTFVQSTSIAHWVDMPTVVIVAKAERGGSRLAQAGATGLLQ